MAIATPANSGVACLRDAGQSDLAFPRFGVAASITVTVASVAINLPVDQNGSLYKAYSVSATGNAWVNINTAGDAAVAAAANNYLVNGSGVSFVIPTPAGLVPGATAQISGIMDSGGAGKICVIGII